MTLKPYYEDDLVTLYHGDCREILPSVGPVDVVVTDPPYGDTSLPWDEPVKGWLQLVDAPQVWCFGSLRFFLEHGADFREGWRYGQEIVWEKHNGSGFRSDRFKRVHELAVHWYRGEWQRLYLAVPVVSDQRRIRATRRANGTPHTGDIGASTYDSTMRLMRSVLKVRSEHGRAVHPTQKPVGIVRPLVEYSCPPGGIVLDPFAGSGTTLIAARELGRRAIGAEVNEDYCRAAVDRLGQRDLFSSERAA